MLDVFVASSSNNDHQLGIIRGASRQASTSQRKVMPWIDRDQAGSAIDRTVEEWVSQCDAFIADITTVNHNVTYELGYAMGLNKPTRLIRSVSGDFGKTKSVGLLSSLVHDSYSGIGDLTNILSRPDASPQWPEEHKASEQPIFILQPFNLTEESRTLISAVKKIAFMKFRSFSPAEANRLSAGEAYDHVSSSHGVVVFWQNDNGDAATKNNQRAAFISGLSRGMGVPTIILAHESQSLPLDLEANAHRWSILSHIDNIVKVFRDKVASHQSDYVNLKKKRLGLLNSITCGDPVAENEATDLSYHFIETVAYQRALDGDVNVLHGRKGSGKTAIFLQVRDRIRNNKNNIVIDLIPDGYQLVKMKEAILDHLSRGTRKEIIAAFWEYILWLEIAYKILEKDRRKAAHDHTLSKRYQDLQSLFHKRVDTGSGDFSERMKLLTDNIIERFQSSSSDLTDIKHLSSSKVLEIIYDKGVSELRDCVVEYLKIKGFVLFLFDNLDRFWTPGGFNQDDALIVVGLTESMQEIQRKFRKSELEFRWSIFVRGDVYEFLVKGMADYGKISVQSLEWTDRDLMKTLLKQRLMTSIDQPISDWNMRSKEISVPTVDGKPFLDFLIDGSMMRPRYLIRLFENARRKAIAAGHDHIQEQDYMSSLKEVAWDMIEDLDREIMDIVPDASTFLFTLLDQSSGLTVSKLQYLAGEHASSADFDRLRDVMIWSGCLGIRHGTSFKFISDCGYKRQYIESLLRSSSDPELALHPTIRSVASE